VVNGTDISKKHFGNDFCFPTLERRKMGGAGQQGLGQRIACKNKSRNLTTGKKKKGGKS